MPVTDAPAVNGAGPAVTPAGRLPLVIADLMPVPDALAEFHAGIAAVKGVVIEQDEYVDALAIGVISQTHTLAVGPGGVGKTYADEKVSEVLDLSRMYVQFRADSKREEVFGPLAMSGLANDRYEHVMGQGFLQDVERASLDEFVDAGKFTRQLLNALNERWFVNGATRHPIPLIASSAMTNFWPADPALDALMDRLPQRLLLSGDLSDEGFKSVIQLGIEQRAAQARGEAHKLALPTVSREALGTLLYHALLVTVPPAIVTLIAEVRREAEKEGLIDRSPRRWNLATAIAQADALLSGGDVVKETNLRVLKRILPNAEDEFPIAAKLTKDFRDPVQAFIDSATSVMRTIDSTLAPQRTRLESKDGKRASSDDFSQLTNALEAVNGLNESLDTERATAVANGRDTKPLDALLATLDERRAFIGKASGLNR